MHDYIKKLSISAMLFAIGLVLPFLTGQIPEIGNMLLPMHIPVMLCGLICGPVWGTFVGAALPLIRSLIFSRPVLYPNAVAMAAELAAYAFVIGILFLKSRHTLSSLYISLISSMLVGRLVWGGIMALLLVGGDGFTFAAFLGGAVLEAIPGIVIQIILIPAVMLALGRAGITDISIRYKKIDS